MEAGDQRISWWRRVVAADGRTRLHKRAASTLIADRRVDDEVRGGHDGLDGGAVAESAIERDVAGRLRPDAVRVVRERCHDVGYRRQDLGLARDRLSSTAGGASLAGTPQCHRLTRTAAAV